MKVTREELRSVVSEVLDEMLKEGRYGRYYGKAGRDPAMDYGRGRRSPHRLDREEYEYNVRGNTANAKGANDARENRPKMSPEAFERAFPKLFDRYDSYERGYDGAKQNEEYEQMAEELIQEREQSLLSHLEHGAIFEDGETVNEEWLYETISPALCECPDLMPEAEYRGRKVKLNKIMRGDVKKFKVFVKDPKTGNVKKVNFGHGGSSARKKGEKTMRIRKSNPKARKNFRARHNCDNPGPKTKARYWACRTW